jgi:hypothetical protein
VNPSRPHPSAPAPAMVRSSMTHDAVILIPGIMGSELVDTTTGRILWGLADLSWYVQAWAGGGSLVDLAVRPEERDGTIGRVKATRLLQVAAFAPVLRGIEPYSELARAIRTVLPHPAALCEFAYDWRLPVEHNAGLLAVAAEQHLTAWRRHPQGSATARLVLVAHSMGGLLATYFTDVIGGTTADDVRATVTLGTPFHGAVKAAYILNRGRGAPVPLPHRRLRRLGSTLPALHDLLPTYACLDEGRAARRLTVSDVVALGGDEDLARQSARLHDALHSADRREVQAVVGVDQPTMQSLTLHDGVMAEKYYTCENGPDGLQREDRMGDSTVYRDAATGGSRSPHHLPQGHSALAKTEEAASHVCAILTRRPEGPPMGASWFGVDLPDLTVAGVPAVVTVTHGVQTPTDVTGTVYDVESGIPIAPVEFGWRDGAIAASIVLPCPGIYRVDTKAGAASAVSQMLMTIHPDDADLDEADT